MATKTELASATYSMLEALTIFRDHKGLLSPIGQHRATEFNVLLQQVQRALPGLDTVRYMESLMEYDSVINLIGRLTILKSIIDRATARQWLGHRD
jgi:hypothetical protein